MLNKLVRSDERRVKEIISMSTSYYIKYCTEKIHVHKHIHIYICFYRRFIFLLVSVVSLYTNNQKNNKNFILN